MKWGRNELTALAVGWIVLAAVVVIVCVLLPTPPDVRAAPRLTSVMLDFFFGAVAVAIAGSLVSMVLIVWSVRSLRRETEQRLEEIARLLAKRHGGER